MGLYEDQELVLRDCSERFERLGIPYMLTGSMSMIVYAMMRMTNDIDIVMEVTVGDATRIISEFVPDYYVPEDRVHDSISRKSMFNLLHQRTLVKVDCVIKKDNEFQRVAFSNRIKTNHFGFDLWVISKDDLIISKLNWAKESRSEMQIRDVANIIRNGYNKDYVESWTAKLGLEDILQDCRVYLEQNYVDGHDS
jgi:hypothetical protein